MKKMFGKRGLALLTTLAILVSMVAMLGGLTVTSNAAPDGYTPKRVITFTVSEGIQQSCLMLEDAFKVAGGKTVKVKGYYKVDSITGDGFNVVGTQATTAATDGWQSFSIDYTVPASGQWKDFGFWQASGSFALADITFEDAANGTVYYDMATDAALTAGTYNYGKSKGYDKLSIWYLMGAYGTVEEGASCTVVVDPVYTPPYEPNRAITFTSSEGIQQSCMMLEDAYKVAAGKTVNVKGYYNVYEITGTKFSFLDVSVTAPTNGWVAFSSTYNVPNGTEWQSFGFWEASGKFGLADITFEDAETGTVYYDMATDTGLTAGTYNYGKSKGYDKLSIWYLMGAYGTVEEGASCEVVVDPVYVPEEEPAYEPKRVISMTTAGTQINGKIYLYNSNLLGSGKTVTVKGYYKVDGYTVADATMDPSIISGSFGNMHADCEWTAFEKTFTTGEGKALDLEFWYTQGTVSFADVTISENGVYIYDMTSDADLVAGTYTADNWAINQGIWYFGFYGDIDAATYTVGEAVEGGIVVIPPPYDPEVVELPELPDMITPDPNGYTPNRAMAIVKGVHTGPKITYGVFATPDDYAVAGNKYYVFMKYAAMDLNDATATISINGTVVKTVTADTTSGWVTLLDENGKPFYFDAVEEDDIVSIVFQMNGSGTGTFAVADFIIADQTGKIVYSLANDKTMHIESDVRYVTNGYWKADPYVAEIEGPTLFPIQTKVETYKPSAYISLTQNDKQRDSSAESFLFFRTNNERFTAGQKYTIKGMIMVDIVSGYGGWGNASMGIGNSAGKTTIEKMNILDTNGAWIPLLLPTGAPLTFTGTAEEDWVKINLFKTYGTVALADIQILDAQGNVVYDMLEDEALKAAVGEFTGNVADVGGLFRHALYNNGVGEVWFADAAQENTETSKQIPTFEETVEVPKVDEECDHNFENGVCTECGDPDPDYVPDEECDHNFENGVCTECGDPDPDYVPDEECDHNFENGVCTECGDPDPDYVEPPAQTGDESMIFVAILGMFAVVSLAALSLNKKKFTA